MKEIDFGYYFTLFDFDSKYYKLYDEYIYDNEKHILQLYNGEISPDDFNLDNKKYHYQILGDYYRYFIDNENKYVYNYDKAIEYGNSVCQIKKLISLYKKGTDKYYNELFKLLPNNILVLEYIANLYTKNDEKNIKKYTDKVKSFLDSFKPQTEIEKKLYYFTLSQYYYYYKNDKYIETALLGIENDSALTMCNFISHLYNKETSLVMKYVDIYLKNTKNNDIVNSILYVNLFVVYKIRNNFDKAVEYLIKSINYYNKNESNDISIIIRKTEYNSIVDIIFDNFDKVKFNTTYLDLVDFRLLKYMAFYYYKIDNTNENYIHNYKFINFYNKKNKKILKMIKDNTDIYELKFDKYKNNIRYEMLYVESYIEELFHYNSEYSDNKCDNIIKLMKNINNITHNCLIENNDDCMICYDNYKYLIKLNCNHLLCLKCLSSILDTDKCPYCRQNIS